jgi:hypothetical protein
VTDWLFAGVLLLGLCVLAAALDAAEAAARRRVPAAAPARHALRRPPLSSGGLR